MVGIQDTRVCSEREKHLHFRNLGLQQSDVLIASDGVLQATLHLEDASQITERHTQSLRLHGRHLHTPHLTYELKSFLYKCKPVWKTYGAMAQCPTVTHWTYS